MEPYRETMWPNSKVGSLSGAMGKINCNSFGVLVHLVVEYSYSELLY